MSGINTKISNDGDSVQFGDNESQSILFRLLVGIQKDWQLSDADISKCIAVSPTTFSGWKGKKTLPVKASRDARTQAILSFLSLYRTIATIFPAPKDQLLFLKTKDEDTQEVNMTIVLSGDLERINRLRSKLDYLRGLG